MINPEKCEISSSFDKPKLSCVVCFKGIPTGQGSICGNFWYKRGPWGSCRQAWCAKCYVPAEDDPFPIRVPVEDGGIMTAEKDKDRFCQGRSGDHFVCPFQCETCHFCSIKGRDIDLLDEADNLAVIVMRRAILDRFWARERGTVQSTASGVRTILKKGQILGFTEKELFPARGPFDLTDD